jgi:hypothetical protein
MSDLYSVIPGLQPTSQEILEAELLCKQILEAQFPDLDLREGTGLRDLVLRPSALLLTLVKKGVDQYFTQNTLNGVDDSTPTEVLDSILSNWFLTRKIGIKSVISARLYFARKKNVSVSSSTYFSTDNTVKFLPSESISYSADAMTFDSYSNEYYIDIELVAEKEGTDYNISSGSLLYFSNFDPYFLRAEINYLKSESINSETNSEFIERSKTAISTRNLINVPSVDSNLKAEFNYIDRLLVVGMGDEEMIRDQIRVVFEPSVPRTPISMVYSSSEAVITMPDHGYKTGQRVIISGAIPSGYNGDYVITVVDTSTFKVSPSSNPGVVTTLPSIVDINDPITVHNGGMVDIFCSDTLARSTIQLTTDEFGKVNLTGPIYEFSRSSISGGDDADQIPFSAPFTSNNQYLEVKSITKIEGQGSYALVTITNHGYVAGRSVIIGGSSTSGFNGTWLIKEVVNEHQFTFNLLSTISTTSNDVGMTAKFVTPWNDFGFSERQSLVVDFGTVYANKTARFDIGYFQNLDSIQNYLDDPNNRVLCADYLAKGFNFYKLSVEVTSYNSTVPDASAVESVVQNYLKSLDLGDMFVMSDMMSQLRLNGIVNIQNPPNVTYKKYTRDLTTVKTGTITDILDPNDRTNVFLLDSVATHAQNIAANNIVIN